MIKKKKLGLIVRCLAFIKDGIMFGMMNIKEPKNRLKYQIHHLKLLENMLLDERRFLEEHLDQIEEKEKDNEKV